MPHLLSVWPSVIERFRRARRILLLFDYDGTLTPIVPRPEQAYLSPNTRQLLNDLKSNTRIVLGVISGRNLGDVRERVGVKDIIYAGNHGLEMEGLGEPFVHPEAVSQREALAVIGQRISQELDQYPGVIIENKGLTLSVHYRLTPEGLIGQVETVFNRMVAPGVGDNVIRITRGKKVFEVRPNVDWGKGEAIARIMEFQSDSKLAPETLAPETLAPGTLAPGTLADSIPTDGTLSTYFGDDLTDEAGFSVVQDADGIAVFVGLARQPTQAGYRLDSPAEVAETLRLLGQL